MMNKIHLQAKVGILSQRLKNMNEEIISMYSVVISLLMSSNLSTQMRYILSVISPDKSGIGYPF